jgi:cell division protein FtsL
MRWKQASNESLFFGLKALGITLIVAMFMVWQHVQARRLERQLKGMRQEEDELVYQNGRMQSQINQWTAPSNLESKARKDLGMAPPDPQNRVRVNRP